MHDKSILFTSKENKQMPNQFNIRVSTTEDTVYAEEIVAEMESSAKARGTGIAKRSIEYIERKIKAGEAFIAIHTLTQKIAGFCYIESWEHHKFLVNSGLLIFPEYRKKGLGRTLKEFAFKETTKRYPNARLFGLTTSQAVMNVNSDLGYRPVTYDELTDDREFWNGCKSCVNYSTLIQKERQNCLCTAMLYNPQTKKKKKQLINIVQTSQEVDRN